MNLPAVDFVFIIIIAACTIVALIRGFIAEIFGMGAPVISAWMAVLFYNKLVPSFDSIVKIHWLAIVISFLIIFISVFIVLKIIQAIIQKLFSGNIFKSLDKLLGLVFGLVEGLAIVAILLVIITAQPWFDVSSIIEGSIFYKVLSNFIAAPTQSVVNAVNGIALN